MPAPTLADLENRDVTMRIRAIKWAGEKQLAEATPLLVDRLEEQDPAVRFFAIMALEKITGTKRGYDYQADAASRAAAAARWREALAQTPGGPAENTAGGRGGS